MKQVVIIGAGGHAKVVAEVVMATRAYEIIGFVAQKSECDSVLNIPVIGDDSILSSLLQRGVECAVVAIGDNKLREKIAYNLMNIGFELPAIVHPEAFISPSAIVEKGAVIMPRAIIETLAYIGELAIINTGAIVEHDNIIGRAAHIGPGCSLAGSVCVGDRTLIGVGSCVKPGVTIGNDVIVGSGSAVVKNIADGMVVCGVPAKLLG